MASGFFVWKGNLVEGARLFVTGAAFPSAPYTIERFSVTWSLQRATTDESDTGGRYDLSDTPHLQSSVTVALRL